jgi:hypothetical protein
MVKTPGSNHSGKDVNRNHMHVGTIYSQPDGCCSRKAWAKTGGRPQAYIHDRLRRLTGGLSPKHCTVLVDRPVPRNDNLNMAQLELEDKATWVKKITAGTLEAGSQPFAGRKPEPS